MNERDVVDWILAVSGISTSFILAIAAGLAFVVQRARYRREIEPDVRFTGCWINSPPGVSDGEVGFTIHAQVQNSSGSRAHLLRLRGYINLTPTQTDPSIMLGKRASREWHQASRVKELAAGEQEPMAIELVSSVHANPSPLEVVRSLAGVVHFGALTLEYQSEADVAHLFLNFGRKRFKYSRTRSFAMSLTAPDGSGGSSRLDALSISSLQDVRFEVTFTGTTQSGASG